MPILIFAIVIIIVAAILSYAITRAPPLAPMAWMIECLIWIVAALLILLKAGILS